MSEATKAEALDRRRSVKGRGLWLWLLGSVWFGVGTGRIVCNLHEKLEALKYRGLFFGLVAMLCGALMIWVAFKLDKRRDLRQDADLH